MPPAALPEAAERCSEMNEKGGGFGLEIHPGLDERGVRAEVPIPPAEKGGRWPHREQQASVNLSLVAGFPVGVDLSSLPTALDRQAD